LAESFPPGGRSGELVKIEKRKMGKDLKKEKRKSTVPEPPLEQHSCQSTLVNFLFFEDLLKTLHTPLF